MATFNLSVTVPDAQATEILNDFVHYHGYTDEIDDQPNPQTRAAFAKAKVASFVKESVKAYRANKEAEIARQAQIAEVDAIVIS